jgi:putative endonuclease
MAAMARRNDRARPPRPQPLKPAARPEKIAAFRVGISAESRAAAWLIAHGYRILARRWKSPLGEIDIIAARRIWPARTFTSPATTAKPRPA